MKKYLIIAFALLASASILTAQDSTKVHGPAVFRCPQDCGCHNRPVNDYSGLNSLRARLANPTWKGDIPNIGTGLKFENGRILPMKGNKSVEVVDSLVTSSGSYAGENAESLSLYLREMGLGEVPVGPPVFVFFRLAGCYVTDSAQLLSIHAAAELSVRENLRVRITGAADSATGTADKNDALAIARAEHVAKLFKERGVPEDRIETRSEGGITTYEPVSANRNCRIELFVR